MRRVCLMYHDVHEGRAPAADIPPGAARYHVSAEAFQRHLEVMGQACREGILSLTFDDGWRGSLTTGVQHLLDAKLRGTFFITRDFVGRRHLADADLVRQAHGAGMEIGTHGATHRFLSTLSGREVRAELAAAKGFLEDLLGAEVTAGSAPGGAWSRDAAEAAAECGYRTFYTSRPGINDVRTDPFALRRVPIRSGTPTAAVERYARLDVGREALLATMLEVPRSILGRDHYARLRARLLGSGQLL